MSTKSQKENKGSFFNSLRSSFASILSGKKKKSPDKPVPENGGKVNNEEVPGLEMEPPPPAGTKATKMMLKDNFDDLVKSLTSESIPYIRKYAALKLGEIGDKRAIEYLIAAVADENMEVRMAAAKSLGKLGDESLVEKLISTLKDSNEYLREQTIQSLIQMGELAVPSLIKALKSDDWMLPYCAIKALSRIDDERTIKALVNLLEDDSNVYVQKAAIEALEKLGKQAESELIKQLDHEFFYVREKAAKILIKTGSREGLQRLAEAVHKEDDIKFMERMQSYLTKMENRLKEKEKFENR